MFIREVPLYKSTEGVQAHKLSIFKVMRLGASTGWIERLRGSGAEDAPHVLQLGGEEVLGSPTALRQERIIGPTAGAY